MNMRWQWVASMARDHNWKYGAELGVKDGGCTARLCVPGPRNDSFVDGLRMVAVDAWENGPEVDVSYDRYDHKENYVLAMEAVAPAGDLVTILRMTTSKASECIPDRLLDFVFIDASHDYKNVMADITNWTPKVKRGGAVLGHDYENLPGAQVRKAVREFFSDRVDEIFRGPDQCWGIWV